MDLALNNLEGLICHKTQPTNQPRHAELTKWNELEICIPKRNTSRSCDEQTRLQSKDDSYRPLQVIWVCIIEKKQDSNCCIAT